MRHETVTLKLPQTLLHDASNIASTQNVTIGHLVRALLKKEVDRRLQARTPDRIEDRRMAALKASLAMELELADGWDDLSVRLCKQACELRHDGNGLAVFRHPCGTWLFNVSELGSSLRQLVRRFECAMPGHAHGAGDQGQELTLPLQPSLPLDGDATFEVIDFDA